MKTLATNTDLAVLKPNVAPIFLAEITFLKPTDLTIYLCSRPFDTRNTFDGNVYDPLIASFGDVDTGAIDPFSWKTQAGQMQLSVLNGVPVGGKQSFAHVLNYYDWAFSIVRLFHIFEGATTAGDEIETFYGQIENPESITASVVSLLVSDIGLGLRERWPLRLVNSTVFSGADPDDLGAMLPQVFGEAKRVPARAIAAGGKTSIAEDMTDTTPGDAGSLEITDGAAFPTGAFTLQIDAEQVDVASRSGNTLTLATPARAQGGTTATDHDKGTDCAEVLTHYYFMPADHAVNSIDAVYVDGVRQEITNGSNSDCRVYYGDAADDLSAYEGKAVIDFQTLPSVVKQVNLVHTDTVTDGITVSDNISITVAGVDKTVYPDAGTGANWTNHSNAYDGNEVSSAYTSTNGATLSIGFPGTSYGTVSSQIANVRLSYGNWNIGGGWTPNTLNNTSGTEWFRFTRSGGTFNDGITFTKNDAGGITRYVFEVEKIVTYAPTATKAGSASRSGAATGAGTLTGNSSADTVIGQKITADIKGMFDRNDGFFTGVPLSLIKRPAHVFAKMLMHVLDGAQGLAGYWPCHEATGSTLYDESGKQQNTTSAAGTPEWSTGNSGLPCIKKVGAGEYFNITTFDAPTQYLTVVAWVNTDQAATDRVFSFSAGLAGGWYILFTTTQLRFSIWDTAGPTRFDAQVTQDISAAWHHIAGTYDGETLRLYVDGVETVGDTLSGQALENQAALNLLYSGATTTEIEEIRIYDRPLSAFEINELYENPRGANQNHIDLDEGMLHWWSFNDNGGTLASDGKGGLDLILTGSAGTPTWTDDDERGTVLDFDPTDNQYCTNPFCGNRTALNPTAMSISMWVKAESLAAGLYALSRTSTLAVVIATNGAVTFSVYCPSAWSGATTGAGSVTAGNWHHIVGTYDGTNVVAIVDDGTPASVAHSVGGYINLASGTLAIGAWYAPSNYFDGMIDDVMIFDRVLTAAEITALYDGSFKPASYTKTGYELTNLEYELNLAVTEKPKLNDALNDLARQCRSMQYFEAGVHKLIYSDLAPTTDIYLDPNRIDLESIQITSTLRAEVINEITVNYERFWSKTGVEASRAELTGTAADSIKKYGKITQVEYLDSLDAVLPAFATLAWLLTMLDEPQTLIELTGDLSFSEIERGDIVQLNVDYGCVLHWPLFEGAGTTITDNSGEGVTCTFNDGPTWAKSPFGNALYFDGANDYIDCDSGFSDLLDFTDGDYSASFWINAPAGTTNHRILNKGIAATSGWEIIYDNRIIARTYTAGVSDASYSNALTNDIWHHVAVVRTGTSVLIYVDGSIDMSIVDVHATPIVSNSDPLCIGEYYNAKAAGYIFEGYLADIRIYNRALLNADVQLLYAGKSTGNHLATATFGAVKQADQFRVMSKTYLSEFQQALEIVGV